MILREVDLGLLYGDDKEAISEIAERNNISYELAKEEYQKKCRSKNFKFGLETRCMCSMIERFWARIDTKDCRKIFIECNCSEKDNPRNGIALGVYLKHAKFNFTAFKQSSDYEKKKRIVMFLEETLTEIFEEQHWDKSSLENAFEKIRALDYRNEWKWKKQKKNKKGMIAEVWVFHDVQSAKIVMYIKDKAMNVLYEKVIVEELPDEYAYTKHLGNIRWETEKRVILEGKEGSSIKHIVDIPCLESDS